MGWIGINDFVKPTLRPDAGRPTVLSRAQEQACSLVPTGSLVIETCQGAQVDGSVLVSYSDDGDWPFALDLAILPDQTLRFALHQGPQPCKAKLALPQTEREDRLRITMSWDAPARRGLISIENLDRATIAQADIDAVPPLRAKVLAELASDLERKFVDPSVSLLAVSDRMEPVALMPAFAAGTRIDTEHGPMLVENLRRGDKLRTASGGYAPIRWLIMREVPCAGYFAPVRLRAPYFGLNRDLLVAPDHRLVLSGDDTEYLFGSDAVLVEARHLTAGASATLEERQGLVRLYHVLLDGHELLGTNGAVSESLFVGELARTPELLASTPLADLPMSAMPRHKEIAKPLLYNYETVALITARTA